jgi:hypothetical protein
LQHTEQACFAKNQSKAVSFAVAPKGANFLSLEKVFYNEWKYNAAFIYTLGLFNRSRFGDG